MSIESPRQRNLLIAVFCILVAIIIALPGLFMAIMRFIAWVFEGHAEYDFGALEEDIP